MKQREYQQVLRGYWSILMSKYDKGALDYEKTARLCSKLDEWKMYNRRTEG